MRKISEKFGCLFVIYGQGTDTGTCTCILEFLFVDCLLIVLLLAYIMVNKDYH